ncbi:MAG: hypothetical protein Kow0031_10800 [Anaerolineae bacterium]
MPAVETQVLIVGAGLSGLMAANTLRDNGVAVTLLDKGRSVGGRLATRRIGPGRADHGAQFFTVRHHEFEQRVYQWLQMGLAYRWSTGWSNGSVDLSAQAEGYPRYAIRGGMNALAKHLAQNLNILLNVQVAAVTLTEEGWHCTDTTGQQIISEAVILTAPVPQSLALLEAGNMQLPPTELTALKKIEYRPCIAGLFWVDGPVNLPDPGAMQRPQHPICWIADNQRKGISPEATLITAHASPEYSQHLWNEPPEEALLALTDGLTPFVEPHTKIIEAQLKRWRYSVPVVLHPERYLAVGRTLPLVFAGDAFGEPRVEGAALSGIAAAAKVLSLLKHHSVYDDTTDPS